MPILYTYEPSYLKISQVIKGYKWEKLMKSWSNVCHCDLSMGC